MKPGDFELWTGHFILVISMVFVIYVFQYGNQDKFLELSGASAGFIACGFYRIYDFIKG